MNVTTRVIANVVFSLVMLISTVFADVQSDARITTKVESVLRFAEGPRVASVHVATTDGRVTLFGKVQNERVRATAAEDVRNVEGVVEVRNLLQVVTPGNRARVQRSDDAVKADIQRALRADRSLDDSAITVQSVSNGTVLLSGTAASSSDNVRALRAAADRAGVRRVFSEIGALEATMPVEAISPVQLARPLDVEDAAILLGVTKALNDLDARANADVHVMVKDGVVWLTGTVPTWEGNSSRLHAVRSVTGVRAINNRVRVVAQSVAAR